MMSSEIKPNLEEPQMFNKAWNHPNKEAQRKWQEAICKEFHNMNKQQVWLKKFVPNCRCIKNKWVFTIKCNSVFQAHLVACGYSKISAIDSSENYSLVIKDITFCILLLMVIHFGYLLG